MGVNITGSYSPTAMHRKNFAKQTVSKKPFGQLEGLASTKRSTARPSRFAPQNRSLPKAPLLGALSEAAEEAEIQEAPQRQSIAQSIQARYDSKQRKQTEFAKPASPENTLKDALKKPRSLPMITEE